MANAFGLVVNTRLLGAGIMNSQGPGKPFGQDIISERFIEILRALVVNKVSNRGAAPHQAKVTSYVHGESCLSSTNSSKTIECLKYHLIHR